MQVNAHSDFSLLSYGCHGLRLGRLLDEWRGNVSSLYLATESRIHLLLLLSLTTPTLPHFPTP